jgi:Predicted secreted protein (DUF2259)
MILLLLALTCWSTAFAADRPEITAQGFSPGGRYHLLITEYTQDGSGFDKATLQITDVRRNFIVYRRTRTWESGRADVRAWKTAQAGVLARYGLSRPLTGTRLFSLAPLPQLAYPANTPAFQSTALGRLRLSSGLLKSGCAASDFAPRGLTLSLGERVLQRDTRLPISRQCASGYRLETGWRSGKSLVIIVRSYTQAFEGPDVTPLVVSAALN